MTCVEFEHLSTPPVQSLFCAMSPSTLGQLSDQNFPPRSASTICCPTGLQVRCIPILCTVAVFGARFTFRALSVTGVNATQDRIKEGLS